MRKVITRIALAIVGIIVIFLLGPRPVVDTQIKPINLPTDLDAYLAQSEAQFSDIIPDTQKTIMWAKPDKSKTPLAIVYLHGFSATRQESAPLSDELAAEWGANLYYTRLTGHGRTGEALAAATVNDWLNDTMEALEIGKRIGERVIVIGASTGGTLATWLAMQPQGRDVLAYVLISPNFAPHDPNSNIITWPWGAQLVQAIIGPERSWEPDNELHGRYWTHRYPSTALVPMMGLVKYVREGDLASISAPVLVIYSPNDTVLDASEIERRAAQIGSTVKAIVAIEESGNPSNHELAGRILAPDNTERVKNEILRFVMPLL